MPLDRCAAEHEIDLVIRVPYTHTCKISIPFNPSQHIACRIYRWRDGDLTIASQILNTPQRRLPVRNGRVHIMLHALLIDAEALKREIPARTVMRLHRSRQEQRTLHIQIRHAAFHDGQLQRDDAGHLDRAAEGDFAIALREVEVADAELGPGDVDREENFAAAAQVFDVAVPAVRGAPRYGPRSLFADFLFQVAGCGARVDVLRLGWLSDDPFEVSCADEVGFAAVPLRQDLGGGGTAEDAWMYEAGESQVRDMAGGAKDAFKIPDCFSAGLGDKLSGWARQDRSWSGITHALG